MIESTSSIVADLIVVARTGTPALCEVGGKTIDPLRWSSYDDGNTEYRRAKAWGFRLHSCDCDGDGCDWYVVDERSGTITASGSYPGDPREDFEVQFETCQALATMAAWRAAKVRKNDVSQPQRKPGHSYR